MTSTSYGTALLCFVTIFFITQVRPCKENALNEETRGLSLTPSCCLGFSNATINEPVDTCIEQRADTFDGCKIHAYILANGEKCWCVDPRAWWLPERLKKLEARGIFCTPLKSFTESRSNNV